MFTDVIKVTSHATTFDIASFVETIACMLPDCVHKHAVLKTFSHGSHYEYIRHETLVFVEYMVYNR